MIRVGIIYKARNVVNGKVYIGQSLATLQRRKKLHEASALREDGFAFHRALRKYGFESFTREVLCEAPASELNGLEIEFIKRHNSFASGYNCNEGGGQSYGFRHTEAAKKKMSKKAKKRFSEPANNPMFGRNHSAETISRMRSRVLINCFYCGKEMEIVPSRAKRSKVMACSRECKSFHSKTTINCFVCGKEKEIYKSRRTGKNCCSPGCVLEMLNADRN